MKERILRSLLAMVQGELSGGLAPADSHYPYLLAGLESFSYLSGYSLLKNLDSYSGVYRLDAPTRRALVSFREGVYPEACGNYWASGKEGLYRAWPLAVYAIKNFDLRRNEKGALAFVSRMVSITHRDEGSLALGNLYSQLLWQLLYKNQELDIKKARLDLERALHREPAILRVNRELVEFYWGILEVLEGAGSYDDAIERALEIERDGPLRAGLVGSLAGPIFKKEDFKFDEKFEKEIRARFLRAWLV